AGQDDPKGKRENKKPRGEYLEAHTLCRCQKYTDRQKCGQDKNDRYIRRQVLDHLLDPFITLDPSIANRDHAMCALSDVWFVGDEDDRVALLMQLFKEVHD